MRISRDALLTAGLLIGAAVLVPFAADRLPEGGPLRGTLAVLPLILAGLWAIARWSVRQGAEPLSPGGSTGELVALGVLVLCIH